MTEPTQAEQVKLLAALERNWHTEMEGAATYRELAAMERDEHRRSVLLKLADAEQRHADRWAERIVALGGQVPSGAEPRPVREIITTARLINLETAFRRIEGEEEKHIEAYRAQAASLADEPSRQILRDLARDEASHARSLRAMVGASPDPRRRLESILQQEKWHVSTGNWIGDAIYGINDGLTAVFGIVAGVAGAAGGRNDFVVVAGLAGMVASALSMGASGYLANKSEREVLEAELARERREVQEHPDEEKEELALFYELKGIPGEQARAMVDRLAERPDQFLRVLAQEELGLSAERMPNPYRAAFSATVSTALGALVPVFPFFFLSGEPALIASAVVSIVGHFAVGAAKSLVTLRSWWQSGLEMTAVAVIVAVVTYLLGLLLSLPIG